MHQFFRFHKDIKISLLLTVSYIKKKGCVCSNNPPNKDDKLNRKVTSNKIDRTIAEILMKTAKNLDD